LIENHEIYLAIILGIAIFLIVFGMMLYGYATGMGYGAKTVLNEIDNSLTGMGLCRIGGNTQPSSLSASSSF
jgi:hypothetical protein